MDIRQIAASDNAPIAQVIRKVLTEFGMDRPGTVFTDPTTDMLFETFERKDAIYFVAEEDDEIIGGCGIFPTEGLPNGCAELVKLYLLESHRKHGLGKALMEKSIAAAIKMDYTQLYLETMPELSSAVGLYEKLGFVKTNKAMGNSGHFACDLWMVKNL